MNTEGVRATIDISATDKGLQQQLSKIIQLNKNIQSLALAMSKVALSEEKYRTQTEKTKIEQAKLATQLAKEQAQLDKNSSAKEQNALKTEKLRLQVEKLNKSVNKSNNSFSLSSFGLFKFASNLGMVVNYARQTGQVLTDLLQNSADYIETQNLFEVSMGKATDEAVRFINIMSDAFNLDDAPLKQAMGTFNLLGKQMGLTTDQALVWSETLTKLSADTSSLRNTDLETAFTKLKAGIVGEAEPLREWGIDITEATLKQEALANGIKKSYYEMSYGEKAILRYSAILRQTQKDQGDFADTLESPAQMLRQLGQQFTALGRAVGNLVLPVLYKVLTPLLSIVMVLKEIAEWLAVLWNLKLPFTDNTADISLENAEDFADSLGNAVGSAKELKKWLGGYDELNNVTPTKTSGSSGTGSAGLGIDEEFLKLLESYDNKMGTITNRAGELRDKIMEWLGFTKLVNEETGEITWKYEGFDTTLKNVWNWFKKLSPEGKILTVIIAGLVTAKVINTIKTFVKLLGDTGLFKIIKSLLTPSLTLGKYFTQLYSNTGMLRESFEATIKDNKDMITGFNGLKMALSGVIETLIGLTTVSSAMKDIAENGLNVSNVFELIIGGVTTFIGVLTAVIPIAQAFGIQMSASMALATGGISLIITGVVSLISYFGALSNAEEQNAEETEEVKTRYDELIETMERLNTTAENRAQGDLSQIKRSQELVAELKNLVDENGKVKEGEEDRTNFIINYLNEALGTEYELTGNLITLNGELVTSYEKIEESIADVIEMKKAEAVLEAYKDSYVEALKVQYEYEGKIAEEKEKLNKLQELYNAELAKGEGANQSYLAVLSSGISTIENQIERQEEELEDFTTTVNNYEQLQEAYLTDSVENVDAYISDLINNTTKEVDKLEDDGVGFFENLGNVGTKVAGDLIKRFGKIDGKIVIDADTSKAKNKISNLLKSTGIGDFLSKIGTSLKSSTVTVDGYATGGIPDIGSLFVAGEGNSTEFVGNIGGRTNVINEAQLENALYRAMVKANKEQSGSQESITNEIYIGGNKTDTILEKRSNRRKNITGVA